MIIPRYPCEDGAFAHHPAYVASPAVLQRWRVSRGVATMLMSVLLVGCGRVSAHQSGSANASGTPTASSSAAAIMCQLPVDLTAVGSAGAFADIPQDPRADILGSEPSRFADDPASIVNQPKGGPAAALTYDWFFKKWLPVNPRGVSPDGRHYAYTDAQAQIHVVNVEDGADRVIASGSSWAVIDFGAEGIYAGVRDPSVQPAPAIPSLAFFSGPAGQPLSGLWLITVDTGQIRQITNTGSWKAVVDGRAWSVRSVGVPSLQDNRGNQLLSLDLSAGTVRIWYTSQGLPFGLMGVDRGGRPIIQTWSSSETRIFWITAPGAVDEIGGDIAPVADAFSDSHGVWFTLFQGIGIYLIDGSAVRPVFHYDVSPSVRTRVRIAGTCQ